MAEFILKNMVRREGLEGYFEIASAATSREELYNDIYPPAKRELDKHCIPYEKRSAVQITRDDMEYYDHIILMDSNNMRNLNRMFPELYPEKVRMLMSFAGLDEDVADPWYYGGFDKTYEDINKGCKALLEAVKGKDNK